MNNEGIENIGLEAGDLVEIELVNIFSNERFVFASYVSYFEKNGDIELFYYNPFRNNNFSFNDESQKIVRIKKLSSGLKQSEQTNYWRILWQFLKKHWTNMVNSLRK